MAPEQLAGDAATTQTDLYALGRVLAEILPPNVNATLEASVRACMERDRAKRPQSAYAVLAALPAASSLPTEELAIPTPAMVAATPTAGALQPAVAWLLLAAVMAGALGVATQGHVLNVAPSQVPKPPEVLAERARDVLAQLGPRAAVADRAFWWWETEAGKILFTYRESSRPLVPANLLHIVSIDDPPVDAGAMNVVTLDAAGTPAAVLPPPRTPSPDGRPRGTALIAVLIGLVSSAILARRNLRAGEGDRKGAWRLSLVVYSCSLLATALRAHHIPSLFDELAWLLGAAAWALLWAGFSWLAYISFEPYGRRWWPNTLISWTRLLEGHGRDPLIGRDVLVGALAGVMWSAVHVIQFTLTDRTGVPTYSQSALAALRSPSAFAGEGVAAFLNGLLLALFAVAGLALLRLIFRKSWIAITVFIALGIATVAVSPSLGDMAVTAALGAIGFAVLVRVGLLAFAVTVITLQWLTWLPLTLDANAWYFGQSLLVLLVIAAVATYGFVLALGQRPAFGVLDKS
jgi:hypothetical protein